MLRTDGFISRLALVSPVRPAEGVAVPVAAVVLSELPPKFGGRRFSGYVFSIFLTSLDFIRAGLHSKVAFAPGAIVEPVLLVALLVDVSLVAASHLTSQ